MAPSGLLRSAAALLSALVVLSSATTAADTPKERTPPKAPQVMPFEPTEQLVYEGEFSKLLLRGIKIAELRFEARRPGPLVQGQGDGHEKSVSPYTLVGHVESKGWFRKLFGISFRFHAESTVAPESFNVLRTTKVDEQGKRLRTSEAVFDYGVKRVEWTERDPHNESQPPRVVTAALEGPTQDIISAIYFLRSRKLTPGERMEIAVSDSGQVYKVPAVVAAEKKRMKTVLGRVRVLRLDIDVFGEGRPVEGNGKMSIWVTDDERRLPVKARLSHNIGQLDITLKSVLRSSSDQTRGGEGL